MRPTLPVCGPAAGSAPASAAQPPQPSLAHQLHASLTEVCARHRACERELAVLLDRMERGCHYRELGFATLVEYARIALQLSARKTRSLRYLGRALPDLPHLDAAMSAGELPWTKARELLRVVTPDTSADWVALARRSSNRALETHVRDAVFGQPAPEPTDDDLEPAITRMVLHGTTEEARLVRDLLAVLRQDAGPECDELSDLALLGLAAQRVLHDHQAAAPAQAPTAERHTVVVHVCRDCRRVRGEGHEVDDTTAHMAACDAVRIDLTDGPGRGTQAKTVPPRVRRSVLHRDLRRCRVPDCTSRLWLDLHHLVPQSRGGGHTEDNLVSLCGAHHTLLHDGHLGVERDGPEIVFRFADGRLARTVLDPDAGGVPRGTGRGGSCGVARREDRSSVGWRAARAETRCAAGAPPTDSVRQSPDG